MNVSLCRALYGYNWNATVNVKPFATLGSTFQLINGMQLTIPYKTTHLYGTPVALLSAPPPSICEDIIHYILKRQLKFRGEYGASTQCIFHYV